MEAAYAAETGQVIPTTAARRMYSPTAVRPIPTDRAITRLLARRRTSGAGLPGPSASTISRQVCRFPLCWNGKGATLPRSDCRQRSPPHPIHRVAALDRNWWPLSLGFRSPLLKSRPELQIRIMQLDREGSPPPGLRLPQAKLSRNSNQIARGRIRRFESDMPSHPVTVSVGYVRAAKTGA